MNKNNFINKIVFLVGGAGTRLGDECKDKQKSLVKVGDKTLLDYSINALKDLNFDEIIFVAGYHAKKMIDYASRYNFSKSFVSLSEEEVKRGTAYAVWDIHHLIKSDESFLLVLPDSIWKFRNFNFLKEKDENTVFCMESKDAHLFGQIALDKDGFITSIGLKQNPPKSFLVDTGIYYFSKAGNIFNYLDKSLKEKHFNYSGELYLTTVIEEMIKNNYKFKARELEYWHDCGTLDGLNKTRSLLKINSDIFINF